MAICQFPYKIFLKFLLLLVFMYNRNDTQPSLRVGDSMEHKKTYNAKQLKTPHGNLIIEGPISSKKLAGYEFHQDLVAFRQHQLRRQLRPDALPDP